MTILRSLPGFALALISVSCGGTDAPAVTSLVPADYAATFVQVRDCRTTIEHAFSTPDGGPTVTNIRVLINPESAAAYLANAPTLPANTVVIKEESNAADCSNVISRSVNVKQEGYDPTNDNWHWQRVLASNNAVLMDGRVPFCISCHQSECAAMNRDLMCTTP
jgi:hypothetical protein